MDEHGVELSPEPLCSHSGLIPLLNANISGDRSVNVQANRRLK